MKNSLSSGRQQKTAVIGDFLKILLPDGCWTYGRVLDNNVVAFYDLKVKQDVPLKRVAEAQVAFRSMLTKYAFNGRKWPIVGSMKLEEALRNKTLFIHTSSELDKGIYIATTNFDDIIYINYDEAKRLELFCVYEMQDVEERLLDHFEGRINEFAEMMRVVK